MRRHGSYSGDVRPAQRVEASNQDDLTKEPVKQRKMKWWKGVAIAVGLAAVAFLAIGYMQTRSELVKISKSTKSGQNETAALVSEIGQYMQLPEESPTIATVNDVAKLSGQEFFKNARNGDKVLIFAESGRALLYRPSEHKVIEYSKVDLSNTTQSSQPEQKKP